MKKVVKFKAGRSKSILLAALATSFVVIGASKANAQYYPNTVIRAATDQDRISFRQHDLCRQQHADLYTCNVLLYEQAKREVLGSRYVPPPRLNPGINLMNYILGTMSEMDPPGASRRRSGPIFRQGSYRPWR